VRIPTLILIGFVLGAGFGILTQPEVGLIKIEVIKPPGMLDRLLKTAGDVFISLVCMLVVPLIISSLIYGMISIGDTKKLGKIGGITITYFIISTTIAILIGLLLANLIGPGYFVSGKERAKIQLEYKEEAERFLKEPKYADLLEFIKGLVPSNIVKAMTEGRAGNMLQIIFFSILFGVTATFLSPQIRKPIADFMHSLMQVMIKMVDIIMWIAPIGVFGLIAHTVRVSGMSILQALGVYVCVVIVALAIHMFLFYGSVLKIFTGVSLGRFFKAIRPAQITAFSTSSSAATLPVNLRCVQENLGVSRHVSSFVLPLGATINMDGTAIYQGVATVFIAQMFFPQPLGIFQQATIVLMAVMASIGAAAVPSAGIFTLIAILDTLGIPREMIAIILGVDRILDMCRTTINITGDATCATFVDTVERVRP
jgi:Na+/H+-dicarboxylate symporter